MTAELKPFTPELWQNESGYLTDLAKTLVENRDDLPDDVLINITRELGAVERLLRNALHWSSPDRGEGVRRVALATTVNYGQTPISQYGFIPPVEVSIRLSCMIEADRDRLARRAAIRARTNSTNQTRPGLALDLAGLDDLDF